jgi:hypothetical protein
MSNSTVFTIGSALRQAENDGFPVGLMVDGQWFAGAIGGLDGDGVLLDAEDGPVTIRLTAISVVRTIRDAAVAARLQAPASEPATIAPVLSLTRSEEPTTDKLPTDKLPTDKLPSVAEQLAAQVDEDLAEEEVQDEAEVELEDQDEAEVDLEDQDEAEVDLEDEDEAELELEVEDEDVDEAMAQLALIEEEMALLEHLPEDLTDDERYALAKRRALMAQRAAAAFADPGAIVAGLTGKVIEAPEPLVEVSPIEVGRIDLAPVEETSVDETPTDETPVEETATDEETASEDASTVEPTPLADLSPAEPLRLDLPAEPTEEEPELHPVEQIALVEAAVAAEHAANPLVHSSTQTDDWRAMLVSLRQQAAETPQTTEPEKRRSWRLAR